MLNYSTEATQIRSGSETVSQEEQVENCNTEGNDIENADVNLDELLEENEIGSDSESEQDDPLWSPEENMELKPQKLGPRTLTGSKITLIYF